MYTQNHRPDLGGINQFYGPNGSTPCGRYKNIFTQCTIRNQFSILITVVADVRYGQTDMPYKGEHQTLTIQSMRH